MDRSPRGYARPLPALACCRCGNMGAAAGRRSGPPFAFSMFFVGVRGVRRVAAERLGRPCSSPADPSNKIRPLGRMATRRPVDDGTLGGCLVAFHPDVRQEAQPSTVESHWKGSRHPLCGSHRPGGLVALSWALAGTLHPPRPASLSTDQALRGAAGDRT